jgi:hypothetical protein
MLIGFGLHWSSQAWCWVAIVAWQPGASITQRGLPRPRSWRRREAPFRTMDPYQGERLFGFRMRLVLVSQDPLSYHRQSGRDSGSGLITKSGPTTSSRNSPAALTGGFNSKYSCSAAEYSFQRRSHSIQRSAIWTSLAWGLEPVLCETRNSVANRAPEIPKSSLCGCRELDSCLIG